MGERKPDMVVPPVLDRVVVMISVGVSNGALKGIDVGEIRHLAAVEQLASALFLGVRVVPDFRHTVSGVYGSFSRLATMPSRSSGSTTARRSARDHGR